MSVAEPPKDDSATEAKGPDVVTNLIAFVLVAAIGGGAFFFFSSTTLGRIAVTPTPQSVTVEVDEAGTLELWADVEITHREFSPSIAADELPHVMDYVVELSAEGRETQTQHCNPFNAVIMRSSGESNNIGQAAGRYYDGLIRRCGFALTPGAYTITARSVEVQPDPRVTLQKSDLVLRLD